MNYLKKIPDYVFAIVVELPYTNPENGQPILMEDGSVIYRTNYFGRVLVDSKTGTRFNEWDTDKRFCSRFASELMAENFRRVVLEDLEGSKVVELKPLQTKNWERKFKGTFVDEEKQLNNFKMN